MNHDNILRIFILYRRSNRANKSNVLTLHLTAVTQQQGSVNDKKCRLYNCYLRFNNRFCSSQCNRHLHKINYSLGMKTACFEYLTYPARFQVIVLCALKKIQEVSIVSNC